MDLASEELVGLSGGVTLFVAAHDCTCIIQWGYHCEGQLLYFLVELYLCLHLFSLY